ncbi:hypothetical protein M0R45_011470 [Rubus argutus]|uniref:PX domain-containing protein n=1 Tax=Rubus argutus TaxID=59490 RepID=A0AAW1YA86_RUBAR
MQQRRSPPKHRHDGTSPLPLGMDWSPPPRKWNGRDTVWPHDPHTGWSYCVTIPSWVVLPKSRNSDPVVFYRVQVGVQSPEGITTTSGVLRRFNDFLKLFNDLKKTFPKKNIPPTPPKGLLRMKSRELLEERRCSLEAWMTKLLSDIDISRSVAVASFLELESAARSSFQDTSQHTSEANSLQSPSHAALPAIVGSSSITSDYGSDTAYETSELGTPRLGRDDGSEMGIEDLVLDEDLTSPIEKLVKFGMTNIDEGLFMGQSILEQLEGLPKHKMHGRHVNITGKDMYNGNASKPSILARNGMELFSQPEHSKVFSHAHKLSDESVGSDVSSLRGSEMSNSGIPNSIGDGSLDLLGGTEVSRIMEMLGSTDLQTSGGTQLILPFDQRPKLNRVLVTMQQRLVTARTDMEDLIARLNQEIAVKDYLSTKVKDLEVELETTRQKNKENLQQAILVERERFTKMQWDMEELRRKSLEMELKLKSEQDMKSWPEATKDSTVHEKDTSPPQLDSSKEQLENLSKRYEELEAKSKADIKVLVKEVKSLRSSQTELKHELGKSLKEKSEAEKLLQREKQMSKHAETARKKLLHECKILHKQLQECNTNFPAEGEDKFILGSSLQEASDLLTTSDNRISQLLSEAQVLQLDNRDVGEADDATDDTRTTDNDLRKMLIDILTENASLRKQVNSVIRHALKMDIQQRKKDDVPDNKLY